MESKTSPPISTALNTPRSDDSPDSPTQFLFIVGGDVLNSHLNFRGVVAEVQPTLLGYHTYPDSPGHRLPPIAHSIIELTFETPRVEVIKLEILHAIHRHLVPEVSIAGKFFCFTIHPKSVLEKSSPNIITSFYCYCWETVEVVPLPYPWENDAGIVPVVYCLISPSRAVEDCRESLLEFSRDRKQYMRNFWTGKFNDQYKFNHIKHDFCFPILDSSWSDKMIGSNDQLVNWTIPWLLNAVSPEVLLGIVAAAVVDKRVIFVSRSRERRSKFVLALFVMLETVCELKYPHPCLGIVPISLSSELVNAPTPLIAAINRREKIRKKKRQDCLIFDLDSTRDHQELEQRGSLIFPNNNTTTSNCVDQDIGARIRLRLESLGTEILSITKECPDYSSAAAAIASHQLSTPILSILFNSSTMQYLLSEKRSEEAIWLTKNL